MVLEPLVGPEEHVGVSREEHWDGSPQVRRILLLQAEAGNAVDP